MNETVAAGNQMPADVGLREAMARVLDHALLTRPEKDIYYLPYRSVPGVCFEKPLGEQRVNLRELYPQAAEGDSAFVDFQIRTQEDYEIYLNIRGSVRVFFEGESVHSSAGSMERGEFSQIPLTVKADERNFVRVRCEMHGGEFGFRFLLSVRRYPGMWANDYLYACRAVSPVPEFRGEDGVGITGLIPAGQDGTDAPYQYPEPWRGGTSFDFTHLCEHGDVCYVYTEAVKDHGLSFCGTVRRILVNGAETAAGNGVVPVRAGDRVLFVCAKEEDAWNLSLKDEGIGLPFLSSRRPSGDRAVFAGPFNGGGIHAPEYNWDWAKVFTNEAGEKLYWQFCDGSQLRLYLDSVFFGQWFYALMVGFYGIRRAAQVLGDIERQKLFCRNMCFLAKYYDYIHYDASLNRMPPFMPRCVQPPELDNIGTMGMNLIDAYLDCNDDKILPIVKQLADRAMTGVPRLEDGTFYRETTMWADDLFMSCPFLLRLGRLTGDTAWDQRAADQILGFKKKLYIEAEGLFSHIYFPEKGQANRVPWGRGNGWVMWTLSELLVFADDKIDLQEHKTLFCGMAQSLLPLQDESGLWRQVLNRAEEGSYLETSCTAMFLLAFVRGVKMGLLGEEYLEAAKKAWDGLKQYSIDRDGNVYGVCMGSGCAMEAEYYYTIPTIINDDHGTGIVLAAAAELCELLEER